MEPDLHGGVTFQVHLGHPYEVRFIQRRGAEWETSLVFNLYGFWQQPACPMGRERHCQIGRPAVAMLVGNVETGLVPGEWLDKENGGQ